jgi:hypothetical protein
MLNESLCSVLCPQGAPSLALVGPDWAKNCMLGAC